MRYKRTRKKCCYGRSDPNNGNDPWTTYRCRNTQKSNCYETIWIRGRKSHMNRMSCNCYKSMSRDTLLSWFQSYTRRARTSNPHDGTLPKYSKEKHPSYSKTYIYIRSYRSRSSGERYNQKWENELSRKSKNYRKQSRKRHWWCIWNFWDSGTVNTRKISK